jgi:hypothetical protein
VNNETIGIAGVFVLTSLLFVLLHCFLSLGPLDKRRHVNSSAPGATIESNSGTRVDDSWHLRNPEPYQADSSTRFYESTGAGRKLIDKGVLRYDGRQTTTL